MPCGANSMPSRPSSASCRSNSPRPARIPRPPPSPPPPTSSSRPSRRRRRARSGASIGGQPGHPKHERVAFPPEIAQRRVHRLSPRRLPLAAARHLRPMTDDRAARRPAGRHPRRARWRSRSTAVIRGGAPTVRSSSRPRSRSAIERGGLVGPRLTTLIAYLKGVCHASFSTVRKFLRDVVGVTISRGQLAKIIGKVSRALERPYEELLDDLPGRGACSTSMRPGTSRTASGSGPGASGPGCTRCSRSTRPAAATC